MNWPLMHLRPWKGTDGRFQEHNIRTFACRFRNCSITESKLLWFCKLAKPDQNKLMNCQSTAAAKGLITTRSQAIEIGDNQIFSELNNIGSDSRKNRVWTFFFTNKSAEYMESEFPTESISQNQTDSPFSFFFQEKEHATLVLTGNTNRSFLRSPVWSISTIRTYSGWISSRLNQDFRTNHRISQRLIYRINHRSQSLISQIERTFFEQKISQPPTRKQRLCTTQFWNQINRLSQMSTKALPNKRVQLSNISLYSQGSS